jgi:hypothetical protein
MSIFTVDSTVIFYQSEVVVGDIAAFQLRLALPSHISLSPLPPPTISIWFNDDEAPFVISHKDADSNPNVGETQYLDLGEVTGEGKRDFEIELEWEAGSSLVLGGKMMAGEGMRALKVIPRHLSLNYEVLRARQRSQKSSSPSKKARGGLRFRNRLFRNGMVQRQQQNGCRLLILLVIFPLMILGTPQRLFTFFIKVILAIAHVFLPFLVLRSAHTRFPSAYLIQSLLM